MKGKRKRKRALDRPASLSNPSIKRFSGESQDQGETGSLRLACDGHSEAGCPKIAIASYGV
jgi:hypothetical protein